MPEKVKQIEPITRSAQFLPETYNATDNTIELVAATESEVLMNTWDGTIREVLACDVKMIRMARLLTANLLDNHNRYGSVGECILGAVVEANVKNRQLVVKVRLSTRESIKEIIDEIKAGIIRNVSILYRVYKYEITEEAGQIPIYRAVDWEPYEVSFVAVPADFNAQSRSTRSDNNIVKNDVTIITNSKNRNMPEEVKPTPAAGAETTPAAQPAAETPVTETPAATPAAAPAPEGGERSLTELRAESTRNAQILDACDSANLPLSFARGLINDSSLTYAEASRKIFAEMKRLQPAAPAAAPNVNAIPGGDETDKRRSAMIDGLTLRSSQVQEKSFKPEQISAARNFRGMTLLDVAKDCLLRGGMSQNEINAMSKMDIVGRAITSSTSDFPVLLEGTNRRILLANYEAVADTWKRFCMIGSVTDFREHSRLTMGSFSRLDKLGENSEYKNKKIPDAEKAGIAADTFGNTINVSRKMIINDDLNGFGRLSAMLGRAAARSIEIDVYAMLAQNGGLGPVMSDNKTLFHADHGNIATGAALSVASIESMRVLMASQKDPSGNDFLDIRPSVFLTPIGLGGQARVINDAQYDPDTANKLQRPNMVRGLFKDIVDTPRLAGTRVYAFANPNDEPVLEVAFLDGQQAPYMESEEEFNVDGMKWKVRIDYGTGAIGFRGASTNAGQ